MDRSTSQDMVGSVKARMVAATGASFYQRKGKRILDLVLGVPLCLALLPLMGLVGLAVWISMGWPIFYSSERAGKDGRRMKMWKFRTMVLKADGIVDQWKESNPQLLEEYQNNFKLRDDPRITPLGKILRKLSLDELPQLVAVVEGRMSLVGPRPYIPEQLEACPEIGRVVWSVVPGVTGPWQTLGRNSLGPSERMKLDMEYAAQVAVLPDLKYLVQTLAPKAWLNGI